MAIGISCLNTTQHRPSYSIVIALSHILFYKIYRTKQFSFIYISLFQAHSFVFSFVSFIFYGYQPASRPADQFSTLYTQHSNTFRRFCIFLHILYMMFINKRNRIALINIDIYRQSIGSHLITFYALHG